MFVYSKYLDLWKRDYDLKRAMKVGGSMVGQEQEGVG